MGCIARIGCLFLLVILCIVGWFTRDRWMPRLFGTRVTAVSSAPAWEPLSDAGATRTRAALAKLSQPRGPAYQTLSGGDVASYIFKELAKQLPASADSIQAAVIGDRVSMRAIVRLADLGGVGSFGPLAAMLGDRERVQLGGTFRVVRPGLGEFQVQEVKIRDLALPSGLIPRVLAQLVRGARPAGLSPNGVPLAIPPYVGDIRIADGRITLYKTAG
jgi:hypothetical protein